MGNAPEKKKNGIVVCLGSGQAVAFVLVSLAVIGLSFSLGMKAGQSLPPEAANVSSGGSADRLGALDARADSRIDAAERKAQAEAAASQNADAEAADGGDDSDGGSKAEAAAEAKTSDKSSSAAAQGTASKTASGAASASGTAASPAKPEGKTAGKTAAGKSETPAGAVQKRTGFALQTSSLPSEKAAQEEVRRLSRRGLDAWYSPAEVKGSTTYRVKVGPYATKEEAMADFGRVTEKAGGKPMLANAE